MARHALRTVAACQPCFCSAEAKQSADAREATARERKQKADDARAEAEEKRQAEAKVHFC